MASPDIQDEIPLDAPGSIYASDQLSYNPPPQQRLDQGSGLQQTTLPAIPITRTITVEAVEVLPLNRSVTLMRPSLASSVPTTLERTNEHRTKEHGTNPLVASEESDVVEKTYHDSVSDNHGDQNSKSSNVEVAAASGISETEQDLAQLELHGSVDTTGHNAIRPAEVRADVRSKKFLEDVIPWELQGVVEQGSNRQQSSEPEELPEDQLYCIWRPSMNRRNTEQSALSATIDRRQLISRDQLFSFEKPEQVNSTETLRRLAIRTTTSRHGSAVFNIVQTEISEEAELVTPWEAYLPVEHMDEKAMSPQQNLLYFGSKLDDQNFQAPGEMKSFVCHESRKGGLCERQEEYEEGKVFSWKAISQQKFRSCFYLYSFWPIFYSFVTTGAIFVTIGLVNLFRAKHNEFELDYTRCKVDAPTNGSFASPVVDPSVLSVVRDGLASFLASSSYTFHGIQATSGAISWTYNPSTKLCMFRFFVPSKMDPPVLMYIRLTNFYQNYRTYVNSKHDPQLRGTFIETAASLSGLLSPSCGVYQYANCTDAASVAGIDLGQMSVSGNMTGVSHSTISNELHTSLSTDCWLLPKLRSPVIQKASKDAQYYPCGLIANSMFTDEFSDLLLLEEMCSDVQFESDLKQLAQSAVTTKIPACNGYLKNSSISNTSSQTQQNKFPYPSDEDISKMEATLSEPSLNYKFIAYNINRLVHRQGYRASQWNATAERQQLIPTHLIPPPRWRETWPVWRDGYNSSNIPDLNRWERLQVWMQPAGLPRFKKLWGRNDFRSFGPGIYEISITDNFDVLRFQGKKAIVITSLLRSSIRSFYVPILLICAGFIFLFAGATMAGLQFTLGRSFGDQSKLSWSETGKQLSRAKGRLQRKVVPDGGGDGDSSKNMDRRK